MLREGEKAPDFALPDDNGEVRRLSDFTGKKKVIYFYPKDNTPGCTEEACGFRDTYETILATGAIVIGISPDSVRSHASFKTKYDLPFFLLSDPEKKVIRAYEALTTRKVKGEEKARVRRCTYIIDEHDVIRAVFPDVRPEEHAREVLEILSRME
ncbi:alkyl hydroperoxide reductase/ Thiol specific antioxidant/ Mal allergen [Spirochaeta thermophila DSM 6578]|uniref:thioredoxin-dependent peroxiredoxin n=1 Tax=Winmispira thermophila (strain ATCC 700085 / DSM 6578 / Z-1203) TaxID=869211 RepID=G0GBL3_WINT7|nr:peroxiredoxin [Spirochaeta thermophila]AEJ60372.1 alkyl hydroperoxide reductase/ Thiol specific antioxidant/ Mal allergen [Spirochaeta thermophila DSM 6578]